MTLCSKRGNGRLLFVAGSSRSSQEQSQQKQSLVGARETAMMSSELRRMGGVSSC